LALKEDPSVSNGAQPEKEREKPGLKIGSGGKPGKAALNGNVSKTTGGRGKRKFGE
jgi:hypothetical protein